MGAGLVGAGEEPGAGHGVAHQLAGTLVHPSTRAPGTGPADAEPAGDPAFGQPLFGPNGDIGGAGGLGGGRTGVPAIGGGTGGGGGSVVGTRGPFAHTGAGILGTQPLEASSRALEFGMKAGGLVQDRPAQAPGSAGSR